MKTSKPSVLKNRNKVPFNFKNHINCPAFHLKDALKEGDLNKSTYIQLLSNEKILNAIM